MRIAVPKEMKSDELRVALTPAGALQLLDAGHQVVVQCDAGVGAGFDDDAYRAVGAQLTADAAEVWGSAEVVVKVKEPIAEEYRHLRPDLVLFAYLHLAPNRPLIDALLDYGTTTVAYETIRGVHGDLPLLAPMSEVAGRLATQAAAYFLQRPHGGTGRLIGGVPGVAPARVLVLGGGVVGTQAARMAVGLQAEVVVLERNLARVRQLEELFAGRATVLMSDEVVLAEQLAKADAVIGAVLLPGALAPRLVRRGNLADMQPGAVIVDVAIDQGGCCDTSEPTTHAAPTYTVDGVLHYCVANMPGAVPVTSTRALTNATLPYVRRLAELSPDEIAADPVLGSGLSTHAGEITSCEQLGVTS